MKAQAICAALVPALLFAARLESVQLPDLRGKPVAQAFAVLEKLNLRPAQIRIENSAPIGNVVFQDPQPNAHVPAGSLVQLSVSMGMPVTKGPTIPDLIGMTPAQATSTVSRLNLRLQQNGSTPSPQPLGTVVAQTPAARSPIPDNRTVYLTLAAAMPVTRVVPRVIGDPLAYAVRIVDGAGLTTGKPLSRADPGPPGIVIDQYPPPGQTAEPGTPVTLTLSQTAPPPPKVSATVPDLRGQTAKSAAGMLSQARLNLGSATQALDPTPQGQIFDQSPAPGAHVPPGSAVNIGVSAGGVYVPDVLHMGQAAASKRLADAGLVTGAVSAVNSPQPARSVLSQRPAPGTLVRPDTAVALEISIPVPAPATVTVPNVTQMPDSQASGTITSSGLSPGNVTPQPSSQPPGTVIAQDPSAGSMAAPGTRVHRFVSQPASVVPSVVVPPLTHLTLSQARNILTAASLDLGEQTGSTSEDALVTSQSPEAYTQVQPHTQIAVMLEAPVNRTLWEIVGASVLVFAGAFAFFRKTPHPVHQLQDLSVVPHRNLGASKVAMKIGDAPDLALRLTPHRDPGDQRIRS